MIALQGNFDQALKLVRELADTHPIVLVNSVNEYRIEGQKTAAFELHEDLEGELDALCIPVGNAGNITSYWRGFQEMGAAPKLFGFQAEGAAPLVLGHPVEHPETVASAIRIGDPVRWEDAMAASTQSRGAIRAVSTRRSSTPTACWPHAKGCSASRPRRPRSRGCSSTAPTVREQIVCVLTGRGIKDPDTALAHNGGMVIPCEAETAALEEAVLG